MAVRHTLVIALCVMGGCDAAGDDPASRPPPAQASTRDLIATELEVDVGTVTATATVTAVAAASRALSLEIGDLDILRVYDDYGDLEHTRDGARLDIGVPATGEDSQVRIDYRYRERAEFEGALEAGTTLIWPYFCGNLFPCKSDPADGLELSVALTGAPAYAATVYPKRISADAPSYMLAWAVGDYQYQGLGTTPAGTEVGVYYFPEGESAALTGTVNLVAVFEWLETTLGPYTFGDAVASVAADWGPGAFGGMEHHPLWHVADIAMADESVHAHEAAHGWYGNGVRIACWEDFVLSEGTVSYLTARAIDEVVGRNAALTVWERYRARLAGVRGDPAWPEGCGTIDIIDDGLFTSAPYMKGAFFFKSLAAVVGEAELDVLLGRFYRDHVGQAARFQELLDFIAAETGYDPGPCAQAWLRAGDVPDTEICP